MFGWDFLLMNQAAENILNHHVPHHGAKQSYKTSQLVLTYFRNPEEEISFIFCQWFNTTIVCESRQETFKGGWSLPALHHKPGIPW